MNNSVLPSIHFTDNEVKALFIAFMASRNQQLPYLKSRHSLAEKLLGLIPESQQETLVLLNQKRQLPSSKNTILLNFQFPIRILTKQQAF